MIVTYLHQNYDCIRAVRTGNHATLYLSDGGIVELVNVKAHAYEQFSFDTGGWEIVDNTQSLEERMDSLEGTMKEIMTALINLQK